MSERPTHANASRKSQAHIRVPYLMNRRLGHRPRVLLEGKRRLVARGAVRVQVGDAAGAD